MNIQFERDDSGIKVHERGVIARLCSLFRSHEQGFQSGLRTPLPRMLD